MILFYFKIDGTKIELAGLTTLNKMISEGNTASLPCSTFVLPAWWYFQLQNK